MAVDVIIDPSSGQIYWNDQVGVGTQTISISGNATNAINIVGYSNFFSPGGGGLGTQILATFTDSPTSTFTPGTNAYDLGSTSLRWNFYGTAGNFTGVISTSSSTSSTSTTTGALTVAGGLGVVGDVYVASANGSKLSVMQSSGDEGGEIFLNKAVTNTTIVSGVTIDVYQNRLRFFEQGGSARGFYLDITTGGNNAATNLAAGGSTGISSLNGLTASTQTFATGTSGTDFNISSATSTHTFNIPYAGAASTGLITTQTQTIAGAKTFSSQTIVSDTTVSTTTGTGALLVYGGLGVSGQINSASLVTSGNAVINGNLQFKGNGTFGDNAQVDTIALNARFTNTIAPDTNNTYDLGAVGFGTTGPLMWRNIYAATGVSAPNFTGFASTSQAINVFASSTNASHPILFTPATTTVTGAAVSSVSTVSVNPSNSTITATTFSGAFSGNVTGTSTTSQNTTVVFSSTPATAHYLTFIPQGTSVAGAAVSAVTTIFATPSTGTVSATTFSGAFSGTLSGYASTGRNVDVQLATTNAIHAVTFTPQLTAVVGSATSSDNTLVYNPSTKILTSSGLAVTALTETTSATTGALLVSGSAGFARSLSVGTSVVFWNGANYSAFKTGATSNQTYTLPVGYPGAGTSVLSSDTAGTMTWVASGTVSGTVAVTNGGTGQVTYTDGQLLIGNSVGNTLTKATLSPGTNISISNGNGSITINNTSSASGVVNAGVASKIAYYPTSTTTVDDATGMEYLVSGTASTVRFYGGAAVGSTIFVVSTPTDMSIRVGIGVSNPQYELEINGELSATNKSFVINHPTKPGMKLRYGSLEGPENGVYVRGELKKSNIIIVPDHWYGLVDEDTYTVHLTPIGRYSQLYVVKIENYNVYIADNHMNPIHCYYSVWAERKDIPKLITEY